MFELTVRGGFSAAHALRGYDGACENVHGHNFGVELVLRSSDNPKNGMVIDFCEIEKVLDKVLGELDHVNLNDLEAFKSENATSENLARYIALKCSDEISSKASYVKVVRVSVWENERCCAAYLME